jgi:hypothetical protein
MLWLAVTVLSLLKQTHLWQEEECCFAMLQYPALLFLRVCVKIMYECHLLYTFHGNAGNKPKLKTGLNVKRDFLKISRSVQDKK